MDGCISAVLFTDTKKYGRIDTGQVPHQPVDRLLENCMQQLREYFDGQRLQFDLPVFQPGTDFQQKVWAALSTIPFGRTISYLELARRVGDPKAVRAVGTINGKNQLSILVPCHRVIGSDGSLIGYGGDLWRKKWLLDHEARFAHGVQTLF